MKIRSIFFSYLVLTEKEAQFLMDSWHLKRKEGKLVKEKKITSIQQSGISYCQAMRERNACKENAPK